MVNKQYNISSGKMFAHINRVLGEHKPITADVFLTNFCNNKCPYCTYRRWPLDDGARYMSFTDFKKYATRLIELGVKGIILTGGGEPTLNKDFNLITSWLEEQHIHYGINTNFNVLKYFKPDYLKVSLDGWDEDSYYDRRGIYAFEQVRSNIQEYSEWKKTKSPSTSLGIQLLAKTTDEVINFYEANKDLDVDYISIRPMESTNGCYYKTLGSDTNKSPINIIKTIENIASLDSRVIPNFKWHMLDKQENSCTAQWAQIAVNEEGKVMYCCHKPYQIVGDIMDPDILDKKEKAFTDMSMCDIPCRMTAPNYEVSEILKERKDTSFI